MKGKELPRALACLALLAAAATLAAGCWDRSELNELAFVFASGIDWEEDHWMVTAGIVQTAGQGGGSRFRAGPATETGRAVYVVTSRGATLLEAQQNLALFTSRRPRWDHAASLIIGESAARHGIVEILDLWTRSEALRTTTMVALVRGRARDFLVEAQPGLESFLGEELPGIIRLGNPMGISTILTLHQLVRNLTSESHASVAPLFGLVAQPQPPTPGTSAPSPSQGGTSRSGGGGGGSGASGGGQSSGASSAPQQSRTDPSTLVQQGMYLPPATPLASVQVQGTGVFLEDKLAGYLDLHATRGVFWVTSPPNAAVISVSCPGPSQSPKVSVIIEDVDRKTKVSLSQIEISLRVTANMSEQACIRIKETGVVGPHAVGAESQLKVVAAEVAKHIAGEIRAAVAATQAMGADVFRFGSLLHIQNRKEWNQVKDRWPEVYRTLPVQVHVEVKFVATGLTITPPTVSAPGPVDNDSTAGKPHADGT